MKLVIEFGSSKTDRTTIEAKIVSAIESVGIAIDLGSFSEDEVGQPLKRTIQIRNRMIHEYVQGFKYRWDVIGSAPPKSKLEQLKQELSDNEVRSVTLE